MKYAAPKEYNHAQKLERGIHFTIDINGNWYFHGDQNPGIMQREKLVALFANKALKCIDDRHYLKTPYESYEVEVEDVPLLIIAAQFEADDQIILVDNIGGETQLSDTHRLFLNRPKFSSEQLPYVAVRGEDLVARLEPNVRSDLIEAALAQPQNENLQEGDTLTLKVDDIQNPLAVWEGEI